MCIMNVKTKGKNIRMHAYIIDKYTSKTKLNFVIILLYLSHRQNKQANLTLAYIEICVYAVYIIVPIANTDMFPCSKYFLMPNVRNALYFCANL